jgi:mono/diheme cytochrome c family protein
MKPHWKKSLPLILVLAVVLPCLAADTSWKKHVSGSERAKVNPFDQQPEAIEAGRRLFLDHCSKCHGSDALGRGNHPSLRTPEVQDASDGEIFWILRNGFLRKGMPSWSSIPEPSRWQIIAYVKSLGVSSGSAAASTGKQHER